ncbi:MAG: hypothetical protein N2Z84_02300 [Atribacterota bacterium]|nr:hypothetical protein [Atribacterota bacterium]
MESAWGSFFALASFASFCVACFLGTYLISRFQKEPQLYLVYIVFMFSAVWALSSAVMQVSSNYEGALFWRRMSILGRGTVYSFLLHWMLLASGSRWLTRKWILVLLYLPAGVNVLSLGLLPGLSEGAYSLRKTPLGWIDSPTSTFWNYFYSAYVAVFVLCNVGILLTRGRKTQDAKEKKQAYSIGVIVLAIFAVAWTVDRIVRMFQPGVFPPITTVLLLFPLIVIFYTVIRYLSLIHI